MNNQSISNIGVFTSGGDAERFRTSDGRKQAFENLKKFGIDGLIAIGGDGTFRGCVDFYKESKVRIIGVSAK